jgi:hypothetical protein
LLTTTNNLFCLLGQNCNYTYKSTVTKKIQTLVKSNVVRESGTIKKQATPKQRSLIGVQYSKPEEFQIIIPMWIE